MCDFLKCMEDYDREMEYILLEDSAYDIMTEGSLTHDSMFGTFLDSVSDFINSVKNSIKKLMHQFGSFLSSVMPKQYVFFRELLFGCINDDAVIHIRDMSVLEKDIDSFVDEFHKIITTIVNTSFENLDQSIGEKLTNIVTKYEDTFSKDLSLSVDMNVETFKKESKDAVKRAAERKDRHTTLILDDMDKLEDWLTDERRKKPTMTHEIKDTISTIKRKTWDICRIYKTITTGYVSYMANMGYAIIFNEETIKKFNRENLKFQKTLHKNEMYIRGNEYGINFNIINVDSYYEVIERMKKSWDYRKWSFKTVIALDKNSVLFQLTAAKVHGLVKFYKMKKASPYIRNRSDIIDLITEFFKAFKLATNYGIMQIKTMENMEKWFDSKSPIPFFNQNKNTKNVKKGRKLW